MVKSKEIPQNNGRINRVKRLLFKFHTEYKGYPLYVSANALRHALGMKLNCSIGMFTNASRLYYPNSYTEFFRPRTEHIFLKPFSHTFFSKYENQRKIIYFYRPFAITFDILNYPDDVIDYIRQKPLLQIGSGRSKGYGSISLHDWVEIDLKDVELPSKATHLVLLSPLLKIPNFVEKYNCRYNYEIIWNNGKKNKLKIVPPGQFFRLKKGKNLQKIALKGILRKTLFGGFGFGEFQLYDWSKENNERKNN